MIRAATRSLTCRPSILVGQRHIPFVRHQSGSSGGGGAGGAGKVLVASFVTIAGLAGGTIGYAGYDSEFRLLVEDSVPGSKDVFDVILGDDNVDPGQPLPKKVDISVPPSKLKVDLSALPPMPEIEKPPDTEIKTEAEEKVAPEVTAPEATPEIQTPEVIAPEPTEVTPEIITPEVIVPEEVVDKVESETNVIVLVGDGEINEGSNWESFLLAAHHRLSNLICIVDFNKSSERAVSVVKVPKSLEALGWDLKEVNGHKGNLHKEHFEHEQINQTGRKRKENERTSNTMI